ncbi:MAG: N-acetylmuramoyl-L-alanine amidase [Chloroflexi bacterium]|nr:N-acetylmuramoyl-L-alanine amidase [Chloroflexota bacterium]
MGKIWLVGVLIATFVAFPGVTFAAEGTVAVDGLRLRDDIWGTVAEHLDQDSNIAIFGRTWDQSGNSWYYVGTPSGNSGWVYGAYVKTRPTTGPVVGLQVGHWRNEEAGYPLSASPGATGGGMSEAQVNLAIAKATARLLSGDGVWVDIIPTVIPKGYRANALLAIHADGGPADRRGFFVDRPVRSSVEKQEARLAEILVQEYRAQVDIPHVYRGTPNSRYYYGYYQVHPSTPAALIETGFLTNGIDRGIIIGQHERVAEALTIGLKRFLFGS